MNAWNYPETPVYYEAFYAAHPRYRKANSALIAHAGIRPGQRILDLGAGTGRTAEAALERIGADGQVVCVEPSDAMRNAGKRRLDDPRLEWRAALPGRPSNFTESFAEPRSGRCARVRLCLAG
jgi:cyclopropane fatty-acyl-phospholipid synthase-like methyltransferase